MSRATTHRSSDVEYNGKHLYTVTGRATAAASTQRFGHFVAPCDGTIREMLANFTTQPTHATNDLSFGTIADIDSHLNEVDITNQAVGVVNYVSHANILSLAVTKGEAYAWGWVGGDTTGEVVTTIVIEPS